MTVLIVDDDAHQRLLYRETFAGDGYEVMEAGNATDALLQVRTGRPDVVVLEVNLPGFDGLDTLVAIHGIDRRLPVVLNTAYAAYREQHVSSIADAYVVKSSDLGELRTAVRDVLARSAETRGRKAGPT